MTAYLFTTPFEWGVIGAFDSAGDHEAEFRISIVQRILDGESVSALSGQCKIKRNLLYRWRDLLRDHGAAGFHRRRGPKPGASSKAVAGASTNAEQKIAELERRLGRLALEKDFLRRAFTRVKEARSKNNAPGEARCTEK